MFNNKTFKTCILKEGKKINKRNFLNPYLLYLTECLIKCDCELNKAKLILIYVIKFSVFHEYVALKLNIN